MYCRESPVNFMKIDLQIKYLIDYVESHKGTVSEIFEDRLLETSQFKKMLDLLCEGDIVTVQSLSVFGETRIEVDSKRKQILQKEAELDITTDAIENPAFRELLYNFHSSINDYNHVLYKKYVLMK